MVQHHAGVALAPECGQHDTEPVSTGANLSASARGLGPARIVRRRRADGRAAACADAAAKRAIAVSKFSSLQKLHGVITFDFY